MPHGLRRGLRFTLIPSLLLWALLIWAALRLL
jgi:hypothetical protein